VRTLVLRSADEKQTLLEVSQKERCDLVVVAAHGSTCNPALTCGSVTAHLLAHSAVPLLVLQDLPRLRAARAGRRPARAAAACELRGGSLTAAATAKGEESAKTALEAEARALGQAQHLLRRARPAVTDYIELSPSPIARALERARKHLATSPIEDSQLQKAAEWFLDNYYLIRRVARQVARTSRRDSSGACPSSQTRRRCRASTRWRARSSRGAVSNRRHRAPELRGRLPRVSPLTIAELWALPTMLRVSVLHGLLHFLEDLGVSVHGVLERAPSRRAPPDVEAFGLGPGVGVERSIRALRLLAEIRLEDVLREDESCRGGPAKRSGAHLRADGLRDLRRVPQERRRPRLGDWGCRGGRRGAGGAARERERRRPALRSRWFYLVNGGRPALEARLEYRARGVERLRRALIRRPTLAYLSALANRDERAAPRPRRHPRAHRSAACRGGRRASSSPSFPCRS